jgi:rsbT co-antagonist protein RsbR
LIDRRDTEAAGSAIPSDDPEALRAEIAALRAHIAELSKRENELQQSERLLQTVVDNSATVIFIKDKNGRHLLVNRRYEELYHLPRGALLGKYDYEFFPRELADELRENDRRTMERGAPIEVEETVPQDDGPHTYITIKFPVYDEQGAVAGVGGIATDITDRKRVEKERAEMQQQIIDAQRASLQDMSSPVLEVWEDVLVLPVIGIVDTQRSAEMMDRLLEAVERKQCRFAIIDVTGVEVIDSATAHQFIKLVTAVEYLGARCMLTGVRSAVAQTLVALGMDLGQLIMLRTLKHGLRECIRQMSAESAPRVGPARGQRGVG